MRVGDYVNESIRPIGCKTFLSSGEMFEIDVIELDVIALLVRRAHQVLLALLVCDVQNDLRREQGP